MKDASVWLDAAPAGRRYPALAGKVMTEAVVVGGGLVGLLTAWELASEGKKVIVLERNRLGTGDTGSTTGFLTRIPDATLYRLTERHGDDLLKDLLGEMREAQNRLFGLIEGQRIACDFVRCDSFYGAYEADDVVLAQEWRSLSAHARDVSLVTAQDMPDLPFGRAIRIPNEGRFHARKFLLGLAEVCVAKDVKIFEESEVMSLDATGDGVTVRTADGEVKADRAMVAIGNPEPLVPGAGSLVEGKLSFVIAAEYARSPLPPNQYWDTGEPYFYFRCVDGKTIIIGGCDVPHAEGLAHKPYERLQDFAMKRFGAAYQLTHQWSGSLYASADGLPFAFEHPHLAGKVYVATGLNGNGMVGGALAARTLAGLALGARPHAAALLSPSRLGLSLAPPRAAKAVAPPKLAKGFVPLCRVDEVKEGRPVCKTVDGVELAVFNLKGSYHAIKNTCTHMGGPLCEGEVANGVVTCPWHGGKFDIASGKVIGPPPVRDIQTYRVRVAGDMLEIEVKAALPAPPAPHMRRWPTMVGVGILVFIFWAFQFLEQYFHWSRGLLFESLVRSFGLTGSTLFACALFSSALFKWVPKLASKWRFRRYLGVSGFVCISLHVFFALHWYFKYDLVSIFTPLNPFVNPVMFGVIAFPIFMAMAMTSSDWAVATLTPKRWKTLHRFVYIAFLASIFHFALLERGILLRMPFGLLLIGLTAAALFGEIFWYVRIASKVRFRSWGALYGAVLILLALAGLWKAMVS